MATDADPCLARAVGTSRLRRRSPRPTPTPHRARVRAAPPLSSSTRARADARFTRVLYHHQHKPPAPRARGLRRAPHRARRLRAAPGQPHVFLSLAVLALIPYCLDPHAPSVCLILSIAVVVVVCVFAVLNLGSLQITFVPHAGDEKCLEYHQRDAGLDSGIDGCIHKSRVYSMQKIPIPFTGPVAFQLADVLLHAADVIGQVSCAGHDVVESGRDQFNLHIKLLQLFNDFVVACFANV